MPAASGAPPDPRALATLVGFQRAEATAHVVYRALANRVKDERERALLLRIANEEREHAAVWRGYTGRDIGPDRLRAAWLTFLGRLLGHTFVLKRMEYGEYGDASGYAAVVGVYPEAAALMEQEKAHERELAELLDEERLRYVGSMVLGLNDALVELTGAIAGLTFALGDARVVALAGIVTGVSATLSMAASNYLAQRTDGNAHAFRSSLYTGVAYLLTVVCLVTPYLLYPRDMAYAALATMLGVVVLVIAFFTYYVAVAKSLPFLRRFAEMAAISLGVACVSFAIGLAAKRLLGVDPA